MRLMIAMACVLIFSVTAFAQSPGDRCHVYVMDVRKIEEFRKNVNPDDLSKKSAQEQAAVMKAAGLTVFPDFFTKVGEEEMTTKSYPFPEDKAWITASVFYTDESLASTKSADSMLLAIAVGPKALQDAVADEGAASAEITYDDNTDVVRVKKNVVINRRSYLVGLECRCRKQ